MNDVLSGITIFAEGAWEILVVVLVATLGWYILSLALEAYRTKDVKKVMSGITGWVAVVILSAVALVPLALWLFGSIYESVVHHPVLITAKETVSESARFTTDVIDGDGKVTMPNIPPPIKSVGDPVVVSTVNQEEQPQHQPIVVNVHTGDGNTTSSQPLGNVSVGQTPQEVPPTPSAPSMSTGSYTVQRGDTLYRIAKAKYGDGEKWRTLCDHNFGGNKSRCDNLRVGQVITIP
jgi:nucleoid-associated protein YgaU